MQDRGSSSPLQNSQDLASDPGYSASDGSGHLVEEPDHSASPSIEARFCQLLQDASREKEHKTSNDDVKNSLTETAAELLLIDPRAFKVTYEVDEGLSNKVKGLIEYWWGEPWDWWPLGDYRPGFPADEASLRWTCV